MAEWLKGTPWDSAPTSQQRPAKRFESSLPWYPHSASKSAENPGLHRDNWQTSSDVKKPKNCVVKESRDFLSPCQHNEPSFVGINRQRDLVAPFRYSIKNPYAQQEYVFLSQQVSHATEGSPPHLLQRCDRRKSIPCSKWIQLVSPLCSQTLQWPVPSLRFGLRSRWMYRSVSSTRPGNQTTTLL